jgi:hypothetical protein
MTHPGEDRLALYAGRDLPFWEQIAIGWHTRRCQACRRAADGFRHDAQAVSEAAHELPEELEWDRLALDMRANVQVGLQAAECVAPRARPKTQWSWRTAAALASITVVAAGGWWLHLPKAGWRAEVPDVVLAATADGIELVSDQDRSLTLKHASNGPVLVSVQVDGAMEAHYVDDDTGMVTINNVYVP